MIDLQPKTKKLLQTGAKAFGILVVVSIIAWFAAISPYLTRQEKKRFEAAAAELKKLSQEIQTKIGYPNTVESEKGCVYASAKFSQGPRSCGTNLQLKYSDFDLGKSNLAMSEIAKLKGGQLYPGAGNRDQSQFQNSDDYKQSFSQSFSEADLLCSITYEYADISKLKNSFEDKTSGFTVYLHCGGPARAEHYPVED